jgi:predicted aspartyl protease
MIGEMMRAAAVTLTLTLLTTLLPPSATAEIFKYTDDRGTNHYVEGLESVPQQYRSRAVPLGMTNNTLTEPPPGASQSSDGKEGGKTATTIRYVPGRPIMVNATVNGSARANLLLDTGADKTMINPRVLVEAGAPLSRPVGSAMVTGVAGSEQMQFVTINSLEVAGATVGKMTVAAYDVSGAGDGLLGRDFLDHFSVNIDSAKGIVTLTPR